MNQPIQKLRLTDAVVKRSELPPGRRDLIVWDTDVPGFALRVREVGKSWIIVYRPVGSGRSINPKKMKLGSVTSIPSTSEARQLARVTLGRIAAGADPVAERRTARTREKTELDKVLERYAEDLERREYVNRRYVINGLRTKMAKLLKQDVREIDGAELVAIIDALEKKGKAGAAKDFRSRARAFFSWCAAKRIRNDNPLAGFRRERATRADRVAKAEHGRALTDVELGKVWHAADPTTSIGRLWRFWILTGCRRNEGGGLAWSMVDMKEKLIDLPAVFVKQGRGHAVPISEALETVLKSCTRDARSDLVFPSPRTGGSMAGWTQLTTAMNKACGVAFTIHDIRRTFRTGLSRLGIESATAELALGHARADLEAVYNRDRGLERLRPAFEAWGKHVSEIGLKTAVGASVRDGGIFA